MPSNRNALLRYKTIDSCLRNRRRRWTLEDLIDAVSDALYEYQGIDRGISRRSVQSDIQVMRSSRLGYNAPIVIKERKYYTYNDPEYSITNIPLNEQDLERMNEAVEVLKQFKAFSHFTQLTEVVQKLEDHVYAAAHQTRSVIEFEKNEQLKGLGYLDILYKGIIGQTALQLAYQSFTARTPQSFIFHPWWLKEFKNRWFVVGVKDNAETVLSLALDRIQSVEVAKDQPYKRNESLDPEAYYKDVIGVTVSRGMRPVLVKIQVDHVNAPYVETKPLHHSQEIIERNEKGIIISICVQLNYELEREILGFGPGMTVLTPESLKRSIQKKLFEAGVRYEMGGGVQVGDAAGGVD